MINMYLRSCVCAVGGSLALSLSLLVVSSLWCVVSTGPGLPTAPFSRSYVRASVLFWRDFKRTRVYKLLVKHN